jgi:tungstate transport system substrate-binding protein
MRGRISLVILCEQSEKLLNRYSIMAVNPQKHPHVNFTGATELINWYTSPEAQNAIANFKRYAETLFYPGAHK